jgi:hypothetical protein
MYGGYDHFRNNQEAFKAQSGLWPDRKPKDQAAYYAMDNGHLREDLAAAIYETAMGHKIYTAGILLHYAEPKSHVSPDLLMSVPEGVLHNKYTANDPKRGGAEIKNPIHGIYVTQQNGRPIVPAGYYHQVSSQSDTFFWPYTDFIANWYVNELHGPEPAPEKGANVWKIDECVITRVYRSQEASDQVIRNLERHNWHVNKDAVCSFPACQRRAQLRPAQPDEELWAYALDTDDVDDVERYETCVQLEPHQFAFNRETGEIEIRVELPDDIVNIHVVYAPKLIHHAEFPDATLLPLKWITVYLHAPASGPIDPATQELVGEFSAEIKEYWDQPPLVVSMKQADDKSNSVVKVLSEAPRVVDYPDRSKIKNPMMLEWIAKYPHESLSDLVFQFATEGKAL